MPRRLPLAAVVIAVLVAPPVAAQTARPYRLGIAAGAVGPSTVLSEESGVEVRTTTGAFVGAEVMRGVGETRSVGLFARVALSPVSLRVGGVSYGAERAVASTVGVRASQRVSRPLSVRAGVGATFVSGPSDVRPYSSGAAVHPSADLLVSVDLGRRAAWAVDFGGAGYYVGTSDRVQHAGSVAGVLLGVRRAL